jgi:Protein of unknown function (DUF3024)
MLGDMRCDEAADAIERELSPEWPGRVVEGAWLNCRFEGDDVILSECRPMRLNPWMEDETDIARFRWDAETRHWSLYFKDHRERWVLYRSREPQAEVIELVREVGNDPTGIFWG